MKRALTAIICLSVVMFARGQSPNWQWARGATGPGLEEGYGVAADEAGDVFVTGEFILDTATFGTFTIVPPFNDYTMYLTKYSATGHALWAKMVKLYSADAGSIGWAVAADPEGNAYVTGLFFGDSATFDNITLYNTMQAGNACFYIAKYSPLGQVLWAVNESNCAARGYAITTDHNGSVYATGYFQGDSITFGNVTLYCAAGLYQYSFFIVKYDSLGNLIWAKTAPGNCDIMGYGVAADSSGNVYATGYFKGDGSQVGASLAFDSITLYSTHKIVGAGGQTNATYCQTVFIVKYDSTGKAIWAQAPQGSATDVANAITTDLQGNVYITGTFESNPIIFGSQAIYDSTGQQAFFLAKYSPTGDVLLAKSSVGLNAEIGYSVTTDIDENVYATGSFLADSVKFDSSTIYYPTGGTDPIFVVSYNPKGELRCISALGSGGDDQDAISADASGNVYIGGDFEMPTFIVGPDTLLLTGSPASGNEPENTYVAKFNCGNLSPSAVDNVTENYTLQLYPNPFNNQATIQYALPAGAKNASIIIYDMLGQERSAYALNPTGGNLTINAHNLSSGVYLYSLLIDGRAVVTKRMVLQQ